MITINGKALDITLFPDNTSQIWHLSDHLLESGSWVHIVWDYNHEGEIMHLAQLKMLLDESFVDCSLRINYLPYARQDKPVSNNATFALNSFAALLNSLNFQEILIQDPHSHIALNFIKNSSAFYPKEQWIQAQFKTKTDVLCFPDHGALSKYKELLGCSYIYADKIRNQQTGRIESLTLKGNPSGLSVMLHDDLCDAGGTFIGLAKLLYEAGAKDVNLFVTHGLFTKGLKPLKDAGVNRIFTAKGEVSEVQGHIAYECYK